MPDFFGRAVFQVVLHNPTTAHQLQKFSETRFCSENVEFLGKVEQYQKVLNDLAGIMTCIHKSYLADEAPRQVSVPSNLMKNVHGEMKSIVKTTLPAMESLFSDMQENIEQLVFTDVYPRFVRYQLVLSATKALASDRHRYQGLGDCFCLTNPTKADNPIVFASDGFVKVTGYTRPEIIPRNCRFLQGSHTDREPVRRLKIAINDCRESVELILNYKKNGNPFWNLLYVAPLFNEQGKVAFFIGGQVNCSTTIHSNVDVMKVLSTSNTVDLEEDVPSKPATKQSRPLPSARKALLRAFGVRINDPRTMVLSDVGMEDKVLNRMEGQDFKTQLKEFYTAYSKYIVVRADTFVIKFYSEGITEMLNPANTADGLIVGQEIFRFFRQNMVTSQNDYRPKVRNAIRLGNPISVDLRLQTRRSALFRGDEKFSSHWTPLKDENAEVHWIVITLAPLISS
ncbi:uncharacterized protein BCR38DRAFT_354455 [Pseudomassariella vexata]|uniref:RGS domain-containing protein n=1 Tax=Pseudomassariella vexata TaxID=1141098 RepID=A0A1Y2DE17_9PEZI|nr:uncharacterized protein BCR38DRAFT_354455 [Pseudomassariella vexata]ORY57508.1 hypothetical protein BCR38DRAFT_354455 [Pseudomassariella vexata]